MTADDMPDGFTGLPVCVPTEKPPEPDFASLRQELFALCEDTERTWSPIAEQPDNDMRDYARGRVIEAKGIRRAMGEIFRLAIHAAGQRAAPTQSSEPDFAAWRDEAGAVIDDVNDGAPDVDERAGLWAHRYRLLFAASQRVAPSSIAVNMPSRERLLEKTQADPDLDVEAGDGPTDWLRDDAGRPGGEHLLVYVKRLRTILPKPIADDIAALEAALRERDRLLWLVIDANGGVTEVMRADLVTFDPKSARLKKENTLEGGFIVRAAKANDDGGDGRFGRGCAGGDE